MNRSQTLSGAALAACAALLWGTAGTAQSLMSAGGPDAVWVGALRLLFSCLFFAAAKAVWRPEKPVPRKPLTARFALFAAAGALSMVVFNFAFFAAARRAGIALTDAIAIGTSPIWAGIIASVLELKAPRTLWVLGVLTALAGAVTMAAARSQDAALSPDGLLLSAAAGLSYALYAIAAKRLADAFGSLDGTAAVFALAALAALPLAFANSGLPTLSPFDWAVVFYLGFFATGAAYLLFSKALRLISAPTGIAVTLLEPVTAFILASSVAGEPLSALAALGLAAILAGLLAILASDTRQRPGPDTADQMPDKRGKHYFSSIKEHMHHALQQSRLRA